MFLPSRGRKITPCLEVSLGNATVPSKSDLLRSHSTFRSFNQQSSSVDNLPCGTVSPYKLKLTSLAPDRIVWKRVFCREQTTPGMCVCVCTIFCLISELLFQNLLSLTVRFSLNYRNDPMTPIDPAAEWPHDATGFAD